MWRKRLTCGAPSLQPREKVDQGRRNHRCPVRPSVLAPNSLLGRWRQPQSPIYRRISSIYGRPPSIFVRRFPLTREPRHEKKPERHLGVFDQAEAQARPGLPAEGRRGGNPPGSERGKSRICIVEGGQIFHGICGEITPEYWLRRLTQPVPRQNSTQPVTSVKTPPEQPVLE